MMYENLLRMARDALNGLPDKHVHAVVVDRADDMPPEAALHLGKVLCQLARMRLKEQTNELPN